MKTIVSDLKYSYEPQSYFANVELGLLMDRDAASDLSASVRENGYDISDMFPGKVIVKCGHCGQWCVRKTACVYCGAPVD